MKTQLKLILCVVAITAISTQCKAQGGSHSQHVIDSLKITDGDEIKICRLYDDVVTEYLTEWKDFLFHNTRPTPAQQAEVGKKFQARQKEIQPQIDGLKKKLSANYQQLMNFAQFCNYESMRVYAVVSKYQQGALKGYGASPNH